MHERLTKQQEKAKAKAQTARISSSMIANKCMGEEGCPNGGDPIDCYFDLEEARNTVEDVNQSVLPESPGYWNGDDSRRNQHTPDR